MNKFKRLNQSKSIDLRENSKKKKSRTIERVPLQFREDYNRDHLISRARALGLIIVLPLIRGGLIFIRVSLDRNSEFTSN